MNKSTTPLTHDQKAKAFSVTFTIIFFVCLFFGLRSYINGDPPEKQKGHTEIDALIDSQMFVENQLKAPSTAEFNHYTDGVKKINDSTFTVSSFVDSENSFGAKLRANYSCIITYSGGQAQCTDLKIQQ